MNDDQTSDELVKVFRQAVQLLRDRTPDQKQVSMDMEAMDLLMDYALLLGPEGVADVLSILAAEQGKDGSATRSQIELAVRCRLEAGRLLDAKN